ncbi:hypothetical protein H8D30_05860 [bacterium]|nr:hypothetical protein [bacterium]
MEAGRIVQNSVGSGIRALLPLCLLFGSIAPGCHRGNRTESLSPVRVNTVSEPVAVHQQFHNPSAAYLTPGFSEESSSSRRMAGGLNALFTAWWEVSKWMPAPSGSAGLVVTPEYQALNLWDPYTDRPAVLGDGEPPSDAPPGSFWMWEEPHWNTLLAQGGVKAQWFAAGTEEVMLKVSFRRYDKAGMHAELAWDSGKTASPSLSVPEGRREQLAFCTVLSELVFRSLPLWPYESHLPLEREAVKTIEDLKAFWWLWDSEAMLAGGLFGEADLVLYGDSRLVDVDCQTEEGSIWNWAKTEGERRIKSEYALAPPK